MISRTGYNIMSQSCVQGGSNGFSVHSYGSQLVAVLGFYDVVASSAYHIQLFEGPLCQNLSFPKVFQLENFWLRTDLCIAAIGGNSHFDVLGELKFFDDIANYAYHIRISQGFLHQNLLFSRYVQLVTFLLWTALCPVTIGGESHFEFFGQTQVF